MGWFIDRDLKRLIRGGEGPAGKKAVLDTSQWIDTFTELRAARKALQRLGLPTDGTAESRPIDTRRADARSLPLIKRRLSNSIPVGSALSVVVLPGLGSSGSEEEASKFRAELIAVKARLAADKAVERLPELLENEPRFRKQAKESFEQVPSLQPLSIDDADAVESAFVDFALKVSNNNEFILPPVDGPGIGR